MPAGRYFRGLTAYDVLGNIVPGTVALVATMGFLPSSPVPSDLGQYGLFVIVAFSVGAIIQAYASKAVGRLDSFDRTMDGVEALPSLQYIEDDPESTENCERAKDDEEEDGNSLWWRIGHPFVGPLCGWRRPPRGEELDDVILANRIWEHLVDTYEIPFTTDSYSVLYHLMSSEVDDIRSPSRATRMQAIRNFHRGMWIASWYSLLLVFFSSVADTSLEAGDAVPFLGVQYARPTYFEHWTPIWHLGIVAAAGVVVFWLLFESTDEDYIEYLFADYAVSIGTDDDTAAFPEEAEIEITGDVRATFENESATRDCTIEPDTDDPD